MIYRYCVECPGCGSALLLRLSVGFGPEDRFYFVCSACRGAIRGTHHIAVKPTPSVRIELEDGELIEEKDPPDQVINIHPDFPSLPGANTGEKGGSPFLEMSVALGDRFRELTGRIGMFQSMVSNDWKQVRRWMTYYLERDWKRFDNQGAKIFKSTWQDSSNEFAAHDMVHRGLFLLMQSLLVSDEYLEMKEAWQDVFMPTAGAPQALKDFAKALDSSHAAGVQRKLFDVLGMYVEARRSLIPGVGALMLERYSNIDLKSLRVFQDSYGVLRDLYINAFEVSYSSLEYAMGIANVGARGNHNSFPSGPTGSLSKFRKLRSADKEKVLKVTIPSWSAPWERSFDRGLRNSIGHAGVRHDLDRGVLVFDDATELTYVEFLGAVLRSLSGVMISLNTMKYVELVRISVE